MKPMKSSHPDTASLGLFDIEQKSYLAVAQEAQSLFQERSKVHASLYFPVVPV
jgi:hypothetical protein